MAIGRDIYCDTRLIIEKLEQFFPASAAHPAISAATGDEKALEKLLEFWMIDGGVFGRAAQLIPTDMPLRKDPKVCLDDDTSWVLFANILISSTMIERTSWA